MKKAAVLLVLSMGLLSSAWAAQSDPVYGIGVEIQQNEGTFSVKADLPGAPAERAGIQIGDVIEAVQSSPESALIPVTGKSLEQVVNMIRGEENVPVFLEVLRGQSELNFSVVRERIQ